MFGRLKRHYKTSAIILAFSLLVTFVFIGTMLWYGNDINKQVEEKGDLYILNAKDYPEILKNGSLQVKPDQIMNANEYNEMLADKQLQQLLPASLIFLIIMFILSICLWKLLNQLQKKHSLKIALELDHVFDEQVFVDDPLLVNAFTKLKGQFEAQLVDYKRLSSYLTHEQKNNIALLRAKMELSKQNEYISTLETITDSIDDILTLSENVNDQSMMTVDVAVVCAEVFDSYKKVAKNISFEFEGDDDTEIFAKRRWIYRAVANLLDNAIKYGQGEPIILSITAKYQSVIIAVKDHGIGIETSKQDTIFNDHYRVNELNKDGYGLGLSLVSHVCDLCNGFVTMESEYLQGSTFYLSFPQSK